MVGMSRTLDGLIEVALFEGDRSYTRLRARSRMGLTGLFKESLRLRDERRRPFQVPQLECHAAGAFQQRSAFCRRDAEFGGALEVRAGLRRRRERGGSLTGANEHSVGKVADLGRVLRIGRKAVSLEIMRRHHLDHLVPVLRSPCHLQERGNPEVHRFAVLLRQRLVGEGSHQVLQEPVLAPLRRTGVRLDREDLLGHERSQYGLDLAL